MKLHSGAHFPVIECSPHYFDQQSEYFLKKLQERRKNPKMKLLRFFSVHFPLDQLPSQTHSTQNITSSPLTPSFVSRFVCCRRRRAACCVPKNHDDSVGAHPAADVRATAGTPVSLPKQLCHQRWEVSLAMMDESDKFQRRTTCRPWSLTATHGATTQALWDGNLQSVFQ